MQSFPQSGAGAVQLCLDRSLGTAEMGGNFRNRQPLNIMQVDDRAIFRGEREVGRGRACEEANILLSNLYFTFL